ncbi:glycosyltransferase [Flavobacterium sp. RSP49]|uniref:glycosyltransferase n=1 Tax=Flavobacterium sp. RSP49 TaxID=2497487 RepID=UPI000F83DFA5|nr:glycosyltransferase [Flavobacterium sp. RSP49]RTZ02937.1 glycosyltransferase [Flavobacterium sp. RSP49]
MRIIQIIDSLEAGGAERMAISYANALAKKIEFAGLVVTRNEGPLLHQIDADVSYLYLNKKHTFDLRSVLKLKSFVKQNKITIAHAHGTSFFTAVLLKLTYPKIKLIWHDHYGARANESIWNNLILSFCSCFFSCTFVVNHQLEVWANKNLLTKKNYFLPNFATFDDTVLKETILKSEEGKRIVCIANLKQPKNHITILRAFAEMNLMELGWSLHLIGKDYKDDYSAILKEFISKHNLENYVFIYGSKTDIKYILSQATIGILTSTAEGFPVTLLEYGLAKLSVISTNTGHCPMIIQDNFSGLLFTPLDSFQLQVQLDKMISKESLRICFALHLHQLVVDNYSKEKVIDILIKNYEKLSDSK